MLKYNKWHHHIYHHHIIIYSYFAWHFNIMVHHPHHHGECLLSVSTHQPEYKQYLENNFTRYYITISFLSFFIYLHLYGTYEEGWMLDL